MVTKRKIRRHMEKHYPSLTDNLEWYIKTLSRISMGKWTVVGTRSEPMATKLIHMEMNDPWLRQHVFKVGDQ